MYFLCGELPAGGSRWQERLCFEMLRNQNQNLNIVISEDTQKQFEVFRKGNIPNMAMILQVDPANQIVQCDGEPRVLTLTELREALPSTPRFVLYSYAWRRSDGRVQYPMCFIMFTPEDVCFAIYVGRIDVLSGQPSPCDGLHGCEKRSVRQVPPWSHVRATRSGQQRTPFHFLSHT